MYLKYPIMYYLHTSIIIIATIASCFTYIHKVKNCATCAGVENMAFFQILIMNKTQ